MLSNLLYYFKGYVIIKIEGYGVEKLINYLIRSELQVWDISQENDYFLAKLKASDFKKIRKMVRKANCQVSIEAKEGLPFLLKRFKVRKGLIVGLATAVLTIYILSSFIWLLEIKGLEELSEDEIITLLAEAGFEQGVLKYRVDLETVEEQLNQHPQISWADVELKGTKLLVEVAEKEALPEQEVEQADVVAKKSGLIEELIVLEGQAVVEEGEMVELGEKLISGEVKVYPQLEEEQEELEPIETKRVMAEGIVRAKVWYEEHNEVALNRFYQQQTSRVVDSFKLRLGDREISLSGPDKPPFANFKVEEELKSLSLWRNIDFPIEIIRRRYIELRELNERLSYEEAKELAFKQAEERILATADEEAAVIDKKFEVLSTEESAESVQVRVLITTKEEIGEQKNIH
ncbi:sporulation protein YqfD [Fuchsiella alkaliacetigena]|uniref:sporulation protein YqfD n=1 Tax=Fuchsiella alkaliacetigena TaxID=957042 RepID=UPI00200ABD5D|nr:sporulation protein YqfD [Fuchsiella alkaliacetigena]MCK8824457.1 sporulation protein YqfD [Fuchsiella alkaliacetigena]